MNARWMIAGLLVAGGLWSAWHWRARLLLPWFESRVERRFADVSHIEPDSLAALLRDASGEVLLLDTRSPAEFEVSRIEGALRVDWRQDASRFCRQFGDQLRGKRVVFYCSIGYRSSVLLHNVRQCLAEGGAEAGLNLSGGIFRWYNQGRSVVDPGGEPTDSIHPYDAKWGHMVKQR